ncbi:Putative amidase domain-containing protein [Amycolatopsis lurida]|uniref:amidase domain-containing protein n=1 Tax=Amycolatopsis lurida TaxID=31959 RepID=UPI000896D734|nr:amidase domain-containing protein [Amycolatopsis lurida]SED06609.1 Putative amidase domain-containing protein [Amycolatopsis lurida]
MHFFRKRSRPRVAVLTATAAVVAPLCLTAIAQAAPADDSGNLLALTRQYLQDRASRVTDSRPAALAASALTSVAATSPFSARLATEIPALDRLRARTVGTYAQYRNAQVDLVSPTVTVTGDTARVTVQEQTRLVFAKRDTPDSADATRYQVPHVLDFQRHGAGWVLASDALDVPADALDPVPYVNPVKLQPATRRDLASETPIPKDVKPNYPGAQPYSSAPPVSINGGVPIDRQTAVRYARTFALSYNPAYERFGNDCTNFASQVMRAGGWPDVGRPGPDGDDKWFQYNVVSHSRTWAIAHEFFFFGYLHSKRLRHYAGETPLIADLIFVDWAWGGVPDAHLDHTMIITENPAGNINDWSKIKVTYHSTDQDNVPLNVVSDKLGQGANWYFTDTRGLPG